MAVTGTDGDPASGGADARPGSAVKRRSGAAMLSVVNPCGFAMLPAYLVYHWLTAGGLPSRA